ncbi:PQQ-dependent sugar dehydrogenase [Fulvivirgaceae bacterium BMA12]|uniref:PQQ-dependent sugar dehydrogenase n=1 Tax=Agaribacillus aureus TaxID=3051825 RepID=A0ABT8KZY1_9BACT|nr:PQQ-dependent sugar dehydrogenase [Fulvivirgaceae bacterium BMA12]
MYRLKILTVFFTYSLFFLPALLMAQDGRALYDKYCATCHGKNLEGGDGSSFIDAVWSYGDGKNAVFRNIKYGILNVGMPAWGSVMTDDDIRTLMGFIFDQENKSGVSPPPIAKEITTEDYKISVETVAEGLDTPWAIAFLDERHSLVTEKNGQLRFLIDDKLQPKPVANTPAVLNEGQGGLLDVAADPEYAQNGWVYLAYSHDLGTAKTGKSRSGAMTRIVRGKIKNNRWTSEQVIFEAPHEKYRTTRHHYGCRIVFDSEGYLYFSIGDRGAGDQAQDVAYPNGKLHRIHRDGKIPEDNPFVKDKNAIPSIFSYGHRNPQGLAFHPSTGELWETEHGPMGGDELNKPIMGLNYGWPEITYGINYNGDIISEFKEKPNMEQPVLHWTPSIAVCGIDFYKGGAFPKWENNLFVSALKYKQLARLVIEDNKVVKEEIILKNAGRVRDVGITNEGVIYMVLNRPGKILKLSPK